MSCGSGGCGANSDRTIVTGQLDINATVDGIGSAINGRGDRMTLILTARFDTATIGDRVDIGPRIAGTLVPIVMLSPEAPSAVLTYAQFGSVIRGPLYSAGTSVAGEAQIYSAWETYYRRESVYVDDGASQQIPEGSGALRARRA